MTARGSRNADGNVPNANWNDAKFKVNWNNADNADENLRVREKSPYEKQKP